jgi:hypothetical protein
MHRDRSEKEIVFENTPKKTTADVTHIWASELGTAKVLCLESEMFSHAKVEAKTRVSSHNRPAIPHFQSPQHRRSSQGGNWSLSESPQLPKVRRALSMNAAMSTSLVYSSLHDPAFFPLPRVPLTPPEMTESPTRKRTEAPPEETWVDDLLSDDSDWLTSWFPCCVGRYDPAQAASKKVY